MAYISNITEFLHTAIKADKKYALYNYVDTPDFTMNELVKLIRFQLTGKEALVYDCHYFLVSLLVT